MSPALPGSDPVRRARIRELMERVKVGIQEYGNINGYRNVEARQVIAGRGD